MGVRVAFRVMGGIGLYPCMVAMLGLGHEKQHGRQSPHLPPSLPLALSAKSCLSTPTYPHPLGFLHPLFLHLLIIQFQVQIVQIGLGDYFFTATKHKRLQHLFSVYFHSPGSFGVQITLGISVLLEVS